MTPEEYRNLGAFRARFSSRCGFCGSRIQGRGRSRAGSWIMKLPSWATGVSHAATGQSYVHADCFDEAIRAADRDPAT